MKRAFALIHKGRIAVEIASKNPDRDPNEGTVRMNETEPLPAGSSPGNGLLDKNAAAAYLGVEAWAIERLWAERKLAAIKVGRRVRFRRQDLDLFIERNRVESVR